MTDSGDNLIKQGLLRKSQNRWNLTWESRWTVLQSYTSDNHYYLYRYKSKDEQTKPTSATKIDGSTEVNVFNDNQNKMDLMFYVENKKIKEKCVLKAESTQERDEWINVIKTGIDSIKSSNNAGDENDIKEGGMDELTQWLLHFGLSKYESALRDAGLDDYGLVKTMDNDDIESFADDADMKKFHKKSLKKAVSQVKDGQYVSNPSKVYVYYMASYRK